LIARENAREFLGAASVFGASRLFCASAFQAGGMNDSGRIVLSEGTAVYATQQCFVLLTLR
jgi:hypothetical protein